MNYIWYNIHMKICSKCKDSLDESRFYTRNRNGRIGLYSICIECRSKLNHEGYIKNKDKVSEAKESRLKRNRDYVASILKTGCVDCGINDLRVLEFDHLKDKTMNVSKMREHSLKKLKEEIDKCEVVCANCHNIRTGERRNDWRAKLYNNSIKKEGL